MIRRVTSRGFSPCRIMTTAPTASLPFFSNALRRNSDPWLTTARFDTQIGVPFCGSALTTIFSMSLVFSIQPTPRTMYSAFPFWTTLPPTAELDRATAENNSPRVTL